MCGTREHFYLIISLTNYNLKPTSYTYKISHRDI